MGKVLRFARMRQKNRRVDIYLCQDSQGDEGIIIETKRLLNFKKRKITTTCMSYSIETFEAMCTVMNGMRNDSLYQRIVNRKAKAIKADKGILTTDTDGF